MDNYLNRHTIKIRLHIYLLEPKMLYTGTSFLLGLGFRINAGAVHPVYTVWNSD